MKEGIEVKRIKGRLKIIGSKEEKEKLNKDERKGKKMIVKEGKRWKENL